MNALRGKNREEEGKNREEWERIRWQTLVLLSPNLKKGNKMKPKDLIEFPWERKEVKKRLSKEEAMMLIHKL